MTIHPVLIGGRWRPAASVSTFQASNPATGETLADGYPVSGWDDCEEALSAAAQAASDLRAAPRRQIRDFLQAFADRLERRQHELVAAAHLETALPVRPRLAEVELPRTTGQLRQAAAAAAEGSWALPTIDTRNQIRSCLEPLGPVVVFGPNNFPFAFSAVAGGDFAAAIAAGNPVIAKAHPLQPTTSRLLAAEAFAALLDVGLSPAAVQMVYHVEPSSGLRLVADPRTGASAFTGSRTGGLALKAAADAAGKPIYLEMSSINPVVMLPGALAERGGALAGEFASSCLLGGGQFCTNPGFVVLFAGPAAERFIKDAAQAFATAPEVPLLSTGVATSLAERIAALRDAGAQLVAGERGRVAPTRHASTLLRVSGSAFLANPAALQAEAFGASSLCVVVADADEAVAVLGQLEGSLTGSIYSGTGGADDGLYDRLAPILRPRVGRLLNDKMPTGVAVSPAMNHGGPFPATGHPGFTAVGIPASMRRFGALCCYDNVRPHRLPPLLRDHNSEGAWRLIDGQWTRESLAPGS